MIAIDDRLAPADLRPELERFWELSGAKIRRIAEGYDHAKGSPVYTAGGRYTTRGWTEWTQGFEFGSAILQFEATGNPWFLEYGRTRTVEAMAPHVSHFGVHDHGFNNVSTYGNLLRLMNEGRLAEEAWERRFYELALKVSGAVQARRWTSLPEGRGFIHSFNGPHSLFVDTIRSCRSLMVAHLLGHRHMDEGDREIPLAGRAVRHAQATARFSVYFGEGRDAYDTIPGRTAHECVFNTTDGQFRCPNAQQGFSGLTTWTRGLAWAMTGFAEELELLEALGPLEGIDEDRATVRDVFLRAARATCEFYIRHAAADGIPYWDTGAPELHRLGDDFLDRPADPFNDFEPVDSSAACIGAQGLLRLGSVLGTSTPEGRRFFQAGLTVARTLFREPYLSIDDAHEGLVLHSIYHRPNGWDHVPEGSRIPNGESSMWGDYHARELALCIGRFAEGAPPFRFFDCVRSGDAGAS